jgi:hypothetical protein
MKEDCSCYRSGDDWQTIAQVAHLIIQQINHSHQPALAGPHNCTLLFSPIQYYCHNAVFACPKASHPTRKRHCPSLLHKATAA